MIKTPLSLMTILRCAALASALSLGAAFIAQYGFGLMPCELCMLQRAPYALIMVIALLGHWKPRLRTGLVVITGLLFALEGGLASYHSAVEKQLVSGPSGCTVSAAAAGETAEDFLKKIEHAPIVACDQSAWDFHGITMAALNALWSFMLSTLTFAALQQSRKKMPHA